MKKRYIFSAVPLMALLWTACKNKDNQNAAAAAAQAATPVNIAEAHTEAATYYDKYQATVVALNSVELRPQVSGYITGIFFKEGEVVQKGKPLYEIDRRKYLASYEQARANLVSAQANLVRAQKDADRYSFLLKQDAVARQTYDQAVATLATNQSQVSVARAAILSAQTDLSYSIIKAPFTGRIGISQVRLGAQVSPGTTLLNTISTENPIAVDVVINEQDMDRFYRLQRKYTDTTFRLQINGSTDYPYKGKVFAIDRGVNNQTGTVKVRIQFPNPKDELRDGMSGVLNVLNAESGSRVQIPYKAVTEQMGEYFVFVAQDTIARQRKINLGPRIGANIVVVNGLESGEKVITEGFQRLRDGGKITLGPPAQQGAAGKPAANGQQATSSAGQPAEKPTQGQQGK
ncbi:efflux RND transporter periplasmic adaptor subunit [Mucilaginibacter sp. Bleaf8]|uniref:efflux RND transporter periplasmic adaptor subunit n=1 Tax=Mucilaginibacter sp. Bleaf8 TaxID=2834430 RepID=UPI001BD16D8C|nr:efflux RND transporter periplasmic adaptor subunit [Mucilaginibacter sp. Bleaf8]MBS7563062.1 efflux RND transporter periplasmic adaptor subunit [Mucilaginibacter sp. Bleaf8]